MSESGGIRSSEITPRSVYLDRRSFMKVGLAAASVLTTGAVYRRLNRAGSAEVKTAELADLKPSPEGPEGLKSGFRVDEAMTPLQNVISYNNFYEFTTDKESVAPASSGFVTRPWQVEVGGLVHKPRVFDVDELIRAFPAGGAGVPDALRRGLVDGDPLVGIPAVPAHRPVEPMASARYVAFETLLDPTRMPGPAVGRAAVALSRGPSDRRGDAPADPAGDRPLRPRAAGAERCAVATGRALEVRFQGDQVDRQDHAHRDHAQDDMERAAPGEYGFFANVNPRVDHPRWSQATEQRIGESGRRADAAVQRLRPTGGPPVRGHGSPRQLLRTGPSPVDRSPSQR